MNKAEEKTENPWKAISLSDYEGHMKNDTVLQLQTLNTMMKHQLDTFDVKSVVILGIAGGNGLEHIDTEKYEAVYGADINPDYLRETEKRYSGLKGVLKLICADLTADCSVLPQAELVIADLLIEYIGYDCFKNVIKQVRPKYISCGTQIDVGEGFVSDSPYLHSFDDLDRVHRCIDAERLTACLEESGYKMAASEKYPLPNGKALIRTDFMAKEKGENDQ